MAESVAVNFVKTRLKSPGFTLFLLLSFAAGGGVAWLGGRLLLEPSRELAQLRFQAQGAMLKLHDLQTAYRKSKGRYAPNLDALLATSPDPAALRAELTARVDMNTLVVRSGAATFRLEANILDPERTLIKLKGP